MTERFDVVVIGGGQAALAVGYYLRRTGLRYTLVDDQPAPGGAWQRTWPSLRLFSPPQWSSLPGQHMPRHSGQEPDVYPTRDDVIAYLAEYERRYAIPVIRPVRVIDVQRDAGGFRLSTSAGPISARAIVSATGTWASPVVPSIRGADLYSGTSVHSAHYSGPAPFIGRRVVVVGGGNSGAQIVAELSSVAQVIWATRKPPTFLPDEVDGRSLFEQATARYRALQEGRTPDSPRGLGDIVMVASVKEARSKGALEATPMFTRFTANGVVWPNALEEPVHAVIFATGFRPALSHLASLGIVGENGRALIRPEGSGTRAEGEPPLWLVGYGEWTGFASATLIGVGRTARATVAEIVGELSAPAMISRIV